MRTANHLACLVSMLLLLVACGDKGAPATQATSAPSTPGANAPPPPPPPAAGTDEAKARAEAQAMGPGTCEEDVPALRVLPMKKMLGHDRRFDRMLVHAPAYRACLVAMVRDRTAIEDPGMGPKRTPYDRGTLAYDLLSELGHIEYGECIPGDVRKQVESGGAVVVARWLDDRNHRRQVHRCLQKALGV